MTTTDEHFGLLGAARDVRRAGGRGRARPGRDPRGRDTADAPDRDVAGAVDDGAVLPVRELRERSGVPILVDGAQSVGAIPVDVAGMDFFTISGQKWLCGPDATGALVVADPERLRVAAPSYSQPGVVRAGRLVRATAGGGALRARLVAARIARGPARGARRAARLGVRPRCRRRGALRERLAGLRRGRHARASGDARRLSRRGERSALVERSCEAASTSASSRPGSSARRSAAGPATTTSTGCRGLPSDRRHLPYGAVVPIDGPVASDRCHCAACGRDGGRGRATAAHRARPRRGRRRGNDLGR